MPRFRRRRRSRFGRRKSRRRRFRRIRRSVPDPELKDNTRQQAITANFNGALDLLNGVSQGVDVSNRQGRRALFQTVYLKYCVTLNEANQSPQCFRIAFVVDTMSQGAVPNLNFIWTSLGSAAAPLGMRTLFNANRFKIMWTRLLNMDQAHLAIRGTVFKRMRLSTLYDSAGPDIDDISSNALFLILMSDQAGVGGSEPPIYTGLSRVRFTG